MRQGFWDHRFTRSLVGLGVLLVWSSLPTVARSISDSQFMIQASEPESRSVCPGDLETLIPLLLEDLPAYANRVSQRAYRANLRITSDIPGYILLAGRPEYEPLPLESQGYDPVFEEDTTSQIFFTTLDRQYALGEAVLLQNFHWVFLTPTESGWQLVIMFSRLGNDPTESLRDDPPIPPIDTSQGVIAQAIRLWLRDCAAGSLRS